MALTKPGEDILDLSTELTALSGLTSAANKVPRFTGSGTADLLDFLDEDTLLSNSATAVPSQQSVKAYADAQIATITVGRVLLVDTAITGSPSALTFEDSDGMDWSTYSSFEFDIHANITVDVRLDVTMSQGAGYLAGINYTWASHGVNLVGATHSNGAAAIQIPYNGAAIYKGGAGYNEGFSLIGTLTSKAGSTDVRGPSFHYGLSANVITSGNMGYASGGGLLRSGSTTDVDGIKFALSSGTLSEGYFKVWGIV